MRRTIQTAVRILSSHPMMTSPDKKIQFVLYPHVRESVTYTNLTISRQELEKYIGTITEEYPNISFDYSYLDSLAFKESADPSSIYNDELIRGNHDLWSIHVLTDEQLKVELLTDIANRYRKHNSQHIHHVYDAIKEK